MSIVTWKRALIAGAVFLLVGSAKPIYNYWHPLYAPEDFVTITIAYDPDYCNSNETKRNIRITTVNHSPKQIDVVDVLLAVRDPGHSGNRFNGNPPLHQDWIVKPGGTDNICWYIPAVGETSPVVAARQYSIEKTKITFAQ